MDYPIHYGICCGRVRELIMPVRMGDLSGESLFSSVSTALDSIETCVDCYVEFLGDSYTLASY